MRPKSPPDRCSPGACYLCIRVDPPSTRHHLPATHWCPLDPRHRAHAAFVHSRSSASPLPSVPHPNRALTRVPRPVSSNRVLEPCLLDPRPRSAYPRPALCRPSSSILVCGPTRSVLRRLARLFGMPAKGHGGFPSSFLDPHLNALRSVLAASASLTPPISVQKGVLLVSSRVMYSHKAMLVWVLSNGILLCGRGTKMYAS